MITRQVNADFEPRVVLTARAAGGQPQQVDAVIDTGFNGFLTLPPSDCRVWPAVLVPPARRTGGRQRRGVRCVCRGGRLGRSAAERRSGGLRRSATTWHG